MKYAFIISMLLSAAFAVAQDDVESISVVTDRAEVASVSSTAELVETQFGGDYLYPPANVLSWKGSTTWAPGGRGIGQSLTIGFSVPISYDEIQIVNGFAGPNDLYTKNNRIKKIQIAHVAGKNHFQNQEFELADQKPTWQSIRFAQPQVAKTVSFTIRDIYSGSKYDDTCLSGIRFLYKGAVLPYVGVEQLLAVQTQTSKSLLGKNTAQEFLDNDLDVPLVSASGKAFYFRTSGTVSIGTYDAPRTTFWIEEDSEYSVTNNRVNLKSQVGYVETDQSFLVVPDGKKGVSINGIYYQRVVTARPVTLDYGY